MKKIFNIIEILNDLKDLEKKIYLDSPEVFVDFADRIDIVNLDNPSKNKQFATVKEHILAAATQFNAKDIYDYIVNYDTKLEEENTEDDDIETFLKTVGEKLSDLCGQVDLGGGYYKEPNKAKTSQSKKEDVADTKPNTDKPETVESTQSTDKNTDSKVEQPQQSNMYEPKFICPNCSCNIFETGYSISEKVNYKYSKDEKKLVVTSKEQENAVTCSKCGYTIEQLNPAFLENICTVQNCKKCGKDLTSAGIVTKMKTEYDSESNSFITSKKSFHCAECDSELTDYQVNYFKL